MENTVKKSNVNKLALAGIGIAAGLLGGAQAISANSYHVNAGDTLTSISAKTGVSVDSLKAVNHLDSDLIYANTDLQTDTQNESHVVNDVYTVQAGDTLSQIAEANGSDVDQIKSANGLTNDLIYVGQQLKLHVTANAQTNDQTPAQAPQTTVTQTTGTTNQTTVSQSTQPATQVNNGGNSYTATSGSGDQSAKDWIAARESGGSYTAQNGQYYGKYQLSLDKLGGDLSPQHQEEVANAYAQSRYGGWANAQRAWQSQGWW